jgi:hypothetical protein
MATGKYTTAISVAALLVSIISAAIALYQWHSSNSDARINAAIELSKGMIFSKDDSDKKDRSNLAPGIELRLQAYKAEYVAYLMNTNRVDERYIAPTIKCWISSIHKITGDKTIDLGLPPVPTREMARAVSRMESNLCR